MRKSPLVLALAVLFPLSGWAAEGIALDQVVITAPRMEEALTVLNDPKAPQQPVPANDGAAFLKNIPGFSMIRKGGTDGDPVLRGLAGSRLNVLLDGVDFHGGCGMRMDPPTAYVFPETFDRVTVIKGPQTVLHGNGNAAGVVLFERDTDAMMEPGARAVASLMAGRWGRLDGVLGGTYANDKAYFQATASHAESDDYEDGDGKTVHSFYERESLNAIAGWKLDENTLIEANAVGSQAEAAYADRSMDGVKFDREGYGLKFDQRNLGPVLQKLSAQVDYNYIDHVMDNYSLRTKPVTMAYSSNNPDRETKSFKLTGDLLLSDVDLLTLGVNWQGNEHTLRKFMSPTELNIDTLPRTLDMETDMRGIYGEWRHELAQQARLIGGLRLDDWSADRYNGSTGAYMAGSSEALTSGFLRYERDLSGQPATVFVGLGYSERPMDYWEASTYNGLTPTGALNPEKNTQLDAGLIWKMNELSASISAFYSKIDDYILTHATGMCSMPGACTSLNVDATRYGGEADMAWHFSPNWTLRGSLAYVHGDNDTMDVPLAQTPPLEARLGLDYRTGHWTFGGLIRMVDEQDRIHPDYGNIVGQDLATPADSFATLSLNTSYKPSKKLLVSAGIDNVFDETYAEQISRAGAMVAGYPVLERINEPGRFAWVKLNYRFE